MVIPALAMFLLLQSCAPATHDRESTQSPGDELAGLIAAHASADERGSCTGRRRVSESADVTRETRRATWACTTGL